MIRFVDLVKLFDELSNKAEIRYIYEKSKLKAYDLFEDSTPTTNLVS